MEHLLPENGYIRENWGTFMPKKLPIDKKKNDNIVRCNQSSLHYKNLIGIER